MKLLLTKDYAELSRRAALIIAGQILVRPDSVLGLATGSTPLGTYEMLVQMYEAGILDFSSVRTFNLDEYRGLSAEDPQGYAWYMQHTLFSKINIPASAVHIEDALEADADKACREYEKKIRDAGGIDLQLLGLGENGHIGFNEPDSSFSDSCRCVDLSESTITANSRFFASREDVPRQAYTMGIGSIMRARKLLLLVSGEKKAGALWQLLTGPVCPELPASILRMHPDVTVIAEKSLLKGKDISDEYN